MKTALFIVTSVILVSSITAACSTGCKSCSGATCHQCDEGYRQISNSSCRRCNDIGCGKCPFSEYLCESCMKGYFNSLSMGFVQCSKCTDNCDTCDNTQTCITCSFIAKMNTQKKCDIDGKKLGLILGLALGIPVFIGILIAICCCACNRKHPTNMNQGYMQNQAISFQAQAQPYTQTPAQYNPQQPMGVPAYQQSPAFQPQAFQPNMPPPPIPAFQPMGTPYQPNMGPPPMGSNKSIPTHLQLLPPVDQGYGANYQPPYSPAKGF